MPIDVSFVFIVDLPFFIATAQVKIWKTFLERICVPTIIMVEK